MNTLIYNATTEITKMLLGLSKLPAGGAQNSKERKNIACFFLTLFLHSECVNMDVPTYFENNTYFTRGRTPAHHVPSVFYMICVFISEKRRRQLMKRLPVKYEFSVLI